MNTPEETLQTQRKLSDSAGTRKLAVGLMLACFALAAFGLWQGQSLRSVIGGLGSLLVVALLMFVVSSRREQELREKP